MIVPGNIVRVRLGDDHERPYFRLYVDSDGSFCRYVNESDFDGQFLVLAICGRWHRVLLLVKERIVGWIRVCDIVKVDDRWGT